MIEYYYNYECYEFFIFYIASKEKMWYSGSSNCINGTPSTYTKGKKLTLEDILKYYKELTDPGREATSNRNKEIIKKFLLQLVDIAP